MRYFHLRNEKGELVATLAGEVDTRTEIITYGIAVVGSDETRNKVSYAAGRVIAHERIGKRLSWSAYNSSNPPNPTIILLHQMGFDKAGSMPMSEFITRIRMIRASNTQEENSYVR